MLKKFKCFVKEYLWRRYCVAWVIKSAGPLAGDLLINRLRRRFVDLQEGCIWKHLDYLKF